jgi:hypothetical protein
MLKIFKFPSQQKTQIWIFKNISFVKMKISELTNFFTNMCQNYEGTMIILNNS